MTNAVEISESYLGGTVESKSPCDSEPMFDHGEFSSAWRAYDEYVRKAVGKKTQESEEFDRRRVHVGRPINPDLAERLYRLIHTSESEPMMNSDVAPGFQTVEWPPEVINATNRGCSFRVFNVHSSWAIQDALDEIRDEVATALGTPWKIINVRAWTTPANSQSTGPYAWHSDGYLPEVFKILLYLTPLSPENGYVEFRIDGQTKRLESNRGGAWALFDNTSVIHRGVAGTERERMLVDITICRSAAFDLRARYPGENSHWPHFPWTEATGCSNLELQRIAEWSAPLAEPSFIRLADPLFRRIHFGLAELLCSLAKVLTPLANHLPAASNLMRRIDQAGVDMWNRAKRRSRYAEPLLGQIRLRLAEMLCSLARVLTPLAKGLPAASNLVRRIDQVGMDMWNRAKKRSRYTPFMSRS